ncbi:MAG TPA: hypothetical protein VH165_19690 [Kofleriaceae bacterium]|jgi:hypothetical protein|nr:hypothetical protein [Kofleriaceae bacterium]
MVEYLLDTSVVRALSVTLLKQARDNGLRLILSPISVWEMLAHFEDGKTRFELCKAWMRQADCCEIIEHPDAEIRDAIGVTSYIPPDARIAWQERVVVHTIIDIFSRATSAEEVHGQLKRFPGRADGASCGDVVRQALERMKNQYAGIVLPVFDAFKAEFRRLGRDPHDERALSDREFFDHVEREAKRIAGTADTPTIPRVEERIFDYAFARIGHGLETTLRLLRTGARLDLNDCGDALICNHIDLAGERILVTADTKTHNALSRAEVRFRRYVKEHGKKTRVSEFVMDRSGFEALIAGSLAATC